MIIYKILNNNVVVIKTDDCSEQIVMGRGIAFKKRAGDEIDEAMIDKKFSLVDQDANNKFQQLLADIPIEYINVATKVIEYGKKNIDKKINDSIYVSLSDHIAGAIQREKEGIRTKNVLYWEIKKFYPHEFKVGMESLEIIEKEIGISFGKDEAGFIALHFVNAQFMNEQTSINEITTVMKEIESLVSLFFKVKLDEDSVYYYRFITHLKFFAARLLTEKTYKEDSSDGLLDIIKIKYKEAFECTKKVAQFIAKKYSYELGEDEILYLTIHISRIINECNKN